MLASFPKVPMTQCPKVLKIDVSDYHALSFDAPIHGNPRECLHKPYTARNGYIFVAGIVWVYLYSNFRGGLRKTHVFWNRVRNGHPWSLILVGANRKRVCHFLLVINSNLRPIPMILSCPISEILQVFCWVERPHPYSTRILGGVPLGLDCRCCGSPERRP